MRDKALGSLEVLGYLLVLSMVVSIFIYRPYLWPSVVAFAVLQVGLMSVDRFRHWEPWPFIVSRWRKRKINCNRA